MPPLCAPGLGERWKRVPGSGPKGQTVHRRRVGPKGPGSGGEKDGDEGREQACLVESAVSAALPGDGMAEMGGSEVWLVLASGVVGRGKAAPGQALGKRTDLIFTRH